MSTLSYPQKFEAAVAFFEQTSIPGKKQLSNESQLILYGLQKQAIQGDCVGWKPKTFDMIENAKTKSWQILSGVPKFEAMRLFVKTLEDEQPDWYQQLQEYQKSQQNKENPTNGYAKPNQDKENHQQHLDDSLQPANARQQTDTDLPIKQRGLIHSSELNKIVPQNGLLKDSNEQSKFDIPVQNSKNIQQSDINISNQPQTSSTLRSNNLQAKDFFKNQKQSNEETIQNPFLNVGSENFKAAQQISNQQKQQHDLNFQQTLDNPQEDIYGANSYESSQMDLIGTSIQKSLKDLNQINIKTTSTDNLQDFLQENRYNSRLQQSVLDICLNEMNKQEHYFAVTNPGGIKKPCPRFNMCMVVVQRNQSSLLYIIGGMYSGRLLGDIWILNLDIMQWSQTSYVLGSSLQSNPVTPQSVRSQQTQQGSNSKISQSTSQQSLGGASNLPIASHQVVVYKSQMIIIGGFSKEKHPKKQMDIYVSDIDNLSFEKCLYQGIKPQSRGGHTATQIKNLVYIFGGEDLQGQVTNQLLILDLDRMTFEFPNTNGIPPVPRSQHVATLYQEKFILIFGGGDMSQCFNDLCILDTETMEWIDIPIEGEIPPTRAGHAGALVGDLWYIVGGGDNKGGCSEIFALQLRLDGPLMWYYVSDNAQIDSIASEGMALVKIPDRQCLVAFGGYNGQYNSQVCILRPTLLSPPEQNDSSTQQQGQDVFSETAINKQNLEPSDSQDTEKPLNPETSKLDDQQDSGSNFINSQYSSTTNLDNSSRKDDSLNQQNSQQNSVYQDQYQLQKIKEDIQEGIINGTYKDSLNIQNIHDDNHKSQDNELIKSRVSSQMSHNSKSSSSLGNLDERLSDLYQSDIGNFNSINYEHGSEDKGIAASPMNALDDQELISLEKRKSQKLSSQSFNGMITQEPSLNQNQLSMDDMGSSLELLSSHQEGDSNSSQLKPFIITPKRRTGEGGERGSLSAENSRQDLVSEQKSYIGSLNSLRIREKRDVDLETQKEMDKMREQIAFLENQTRITQRNAQSSRETFEKELKLMKRQLESSQVTEENIRKQIQHIEQQIQEQQDLKFQCQVQLASIRKDLEIKTEYEKELERYKQDLNQIEEQKAKSNVAPKNKSFLSYVVGS